MNILEAEDMIKGLPDQALMQEAQGPSGQVPQYLVVSEIQRRSDMRKRLKEETSQGTIKDQIMGGIGGINTPMPQQGMPPQGGMPVAPSATGMPPQGMPPQMPPQGMPPQGMPPQMPPQGIGAMPPPQQMFSGGIIRLAPGGFTGMPGEGALVGASEAIKAKAQAISAATGRSFDDVYARLVSMAQEQNPDYSMIAPSGMGFDNMSMPSLPDGAGSNLSGLNQPQRDFMPNQPAMPDLGMPSREQAMAGDRAKVESIRQGLSPMPEDMSPLGTYGSTPEEFASQRGSMPSIDIGGFVSNLFDTENRQALREKRLAKNVAASQQGLGFDPTEGSKEFLEYYGDKFEGRRDTKAQDISDRIASGGSGMSGSELSFINEYYEGILPDATAPAGFETNLESMLLAEQGMQLDPRNAMPQGESDAPAITKAIQDSTPNDASAKSLREMIGDLGVQRQGLTDKTRQGATSGAKDFDLSDLIAESKKDTMNNALMQLGAGIAGGDLSKGISAAGMAASKGQQRSKDMAIQERLMSYRAGREDLAREDEESRFTRGLEAKGTQFGQQMDLLERKIDAAIQQNNDTSMREAIRSASSELEAILKSGALMSASDKDRVEKLRNIINQYYGARGFNLAELAAGSGPSQDDPLGLFQ